MAGISLGILKKMQIQAYSDPGFGTKSGEAVSVLINPNKYSQTYSIEYNDCDAIGVNGASPKFQRVSGESMTFELVYDATGVVNLIDTDLSKQITALMDTVYEYDGTTHEPKYLQLIWGTLLFECRLKKIDINYTLFKPTGTPLRAKVTAEFQSFTDPQTLSEEANNNSPDLTHLITVKDGDTLPMLCHKVYKDSSLYLKVAKANELTHFRNLTPGQQLFFPPIV